MPKVVLVTGMQAAGKSTIAPLLASRLGPPAATLDGDVFYRGVVAGGADMTPDPSAEAVRQLELRYDASALIAQHYADAGFDFVCSDNIFEHHVERWFGKLHGVDPYLVMLTPSVESVVERELARGTKAYRDWPGSSGGLIDAVRAFRTYVDNTPRRGLWLDTSDLTPEESVEAILADLPKARW
jgi:chloramphenicol 3-O-phosphotransferase